MTLIVTPTAFTVAKTEIDQNEFNDWVEFNDLGELSGTPLSALMNEDCDAGSHRLVEFAGRHCYRSWKVGRERAAYIGNIIDQDHGSVLEHANLTFAIQGVSRTLTHEMVRHRVGVAISQESQRYVNAEETNFVVPPLLLHISKGVTDPAHPLIAKFKEQCDRDVADYIEFQSSLREALGGTVLKTTEKKRINEAARSRLPNAAETRLTWTANMRTLRHFFKMRGQAFADLEIRRLACHLHDCAMLKAPLFFADFHQENGDYGVNVIVQDT